MTSPYEELQGDDDAADKARKAFLMNVCLICPFSPVKGCGTRKALEKCMADHANEAGAEEGR